VVPDLNCVLAVVCYLGQFTGLIHRVGAKVSQVVSRSPPGCFECAILTYYHLGQSCLTMRV